jgi:undecaprenyl-diphosphatase
MTYLQAIILAVIEGITEFLPISSTGHMVIASWIMGIEKNEMVKLFNVCIQLGAIMAVVVLYYKRFLQSLPFYYKLFVGFIPAAIGGLLLKKHIDVWLERPDVVGYSLLMGGIILLFIDRIFMANEFRNNEEKENISYVKAFIIGCFQVVAMIPGVSRSGATIVGGLSQKLNRKSAAEFSFFLAVPTMCAATAKSLLDEKDFLITHLHESFMLLLVGNVVAFIVALIAIKFFINILTKYGFMVFGIYRIIVGILILIAFYKGANMNII